MEIAVVALSLPDLSICDEFDTLLNPERDIGAQHIHGISPDMVVGAPTFREGPRPWPNTFTARSWSATT